MNDKRQPRNNPAMLQITVSGTMANGSGCLHLFIDHRSALINEA